MVRSTYIGYTIGLIPLTNHDYHAVTLQYSRHIVCCQLRLGTDFAKTPDTVIYDDLIFVWTHPDVRNYAPDIAIVANVQNREADRGQFVVAEEGTCPSVIIEVVSPSTRSGERFDKVRDYTVVGVQEYVYIDHWERKGQTIWEINGYQRIGNQYLPIVPDVGGALYLQTLNLRIGVDDGQVWLEDGNTGQDLMTNLETQRALQAAENQAKLAEERAAALEAELAALRQQMNQ